MPPSLWFKKSIQKPQVWELSRLCPETSMKLYVHEFGFFTWSRGAPQRFSLDDVSGWPGGPLAYRESQSSVNSCCDYPPPVCGHIDHGRIIQGTENTRDASFKENHSGTARSGTHIVGSLFSCLWLSLCIRESRPICQVFIGCSVVAETTLSLQECNIRYILTSGFWPRSVHPYF